MSADLSHVLAWGIDLPEYQGRSYRLGEPTQGVKTAYEMWLKKSAMEECIEASAGLSDEDKAYNRRLVMDDMALKKYRWGGEKWKASLSTEAGISQLVLLLLEEGKRLAKHKHQVNAELVAAMMNDETVGPWLWGAVFYVSGMDPQMALAAGKMAIAGAKQQQAEMEARLKSMLNDLPASLSKTTPPSGPSSST